jgi:uncharacterized protein YjbI with pentapeptide repeats
MRYKGAMDTRSPLSPNAPAVKAKHVIEPTGKAPVPELKLWSIGWAIGLVTVTALLIVIGLVVGALWYGGWPEFQRDGTVTAGVLIELIKLVFSIVAGVGAVAGLVVIYRRQRVAEHASKLEHSANARAEEAKIRENAEANRSEVRLFTERFSKASDQLGSDRVNTRISGVHAMAKLADDWADGRQMCIDTLCAYLRMPYRAIISADGNASPAQGIEQLLPDAAAPVRLFGGHGQSGTRLSRSTALMRLFSGGGTGHEDHTLEDYQEREVRHTVIRTITSRLRLSDDDQNSWSGYNFDFSGVRFDGGDFARARFAGGLVCFDHARFADGRVSFEGVEFCGSRVSFDGADFCGARVSFRTAKVSAGTVGFPWVKFSRGRVMFDGSEFDGGLVSFENAHFGGGEVSFDHVDFSGGRISFRHALFEGSTSFLSARFRGAKVFFAGASICSGLLTLNGSDFNGGRVSFDCFGFSGGLVRFGGAQFRGGNVSFNYPSFKGGKVEFSGVRCSTEVSFTRWPANRVPKEGLWL